MKPKKCTKCGAKHPDLTKCEENVHLCPKCLQGSGYCLGCGQWARGTFAYDNHGYCEHCMATMTEAASEDPENYPKDI
ncbi:MAG: hypothetical protein C5B59_08045 [Bacteroidetes bacterium]|nr:MAG: hypothetical protein C5B59_08045 [Bacteroidota bacterium]